ncbi:MAG: TetR/AcrR family transcriptional regulator [Henriciella sp.]
MKGAQTRQKFVDTANTLFQRHGFHGVGLSRLIEASGAPKGSFYFHFPGGKKELAIAAIEKSRQDVLALLHFAATYADSAADYVRTIGKGLQAWITQSDFSEGCPVATFTLELASTSAEIAKLCNAAYQDWNDCISGFLESTGIEAERTQKLATLILSSYEGAVIMCRAQKQLTPIKNVSDELSLLLRV